MANWLGTFLMVLGMILTVASTNARADDGGEAERSLERPNVYAFSTVSCQVRDDVTGASVPVELRPETFGKAFSEYERLGDHKRLTLPTKGVSLIFVCSADKSRRDRRDVLRYSEVLHVSALEHAGKSDDFYMETVNLDESAGHAVTLRMPAYKLTVTCAKSVELVDTHQTIRELRAEIDRISKM